MTNTKMGEGISKLVWTTRNFQEFKVSKQPATDSLPEFSFCNCPGHCKIKLIKLSNTNENVKNYLVRCKFPLDGSLPLPSIEDSKLNESVEPLNHQHNEHNTKYMSFSYRVNKMQLFEACQPRGGSLRYLHSEKEKVTVCSSLSPGCPRNKMKK